MGSLIPGQLFSMDGKSSDPLKHQLRAYVGRGPKMTKFVHTEGFVEVTKFCQGRVASYLYGHDLDDFPRKLVVHVLCKSNKK